MALACREILVAGDANRLVAELTQVNAVMVIGLQPALHPLGGSAVFGIQIQISVPPLWNDLWNRARLLRVRMGTFQVQVSSFAFGE
eukprot:2817868-Amphidinium_carterae.1